MFTFLCLLLVAFWQPVNSYLYTVDEFDSDDFADYSDVVQIYYLQTSFPYNAPANIRYNSSVIELLYLLYYSNILSDI